jgi:hypothetical protein
MKIEGGCHCGFITYTAEVDPERTAICHCTDCQTITGSAFRTVVFVAKDQFKLLSGQPKTYVKTAESGAKRAQVFCPQCGTSLYAADVANPRFYSLRSGTARQRAQLVPKSQIWCRSAQPWVNDIASIPAVALQSDIPR